MSSEARQFEVAARVTRLLETLPELDREVVLGALATMYFAQHPGRLAEWMQMLAHGVAIGPVGNPFLNNPRRPT